MNPLVSVMMPCCNCARSLPWALASLVAQTYGDWECIFVDDGSTDNSVAVARSLSDPRIRIFRFEANRGRGAARQFALNQAKGKYLCMLDADDWMYPQRIQRQVDVLEREPNLALVSAGMVVIDKKNEICGVRRTPKQDRTTFPPMSQLSMPPVPFAASMLRMKVAKLSTFDPRFLRFEDVDFLLRILMAHPYSLLLQPLYAYAEYGPVNLHAVLTGYRYSALSFLKHWKSSSLRSAANCFTVGIKSAVYCVSSGLGVSEWLVRRRSRAPLPDEIENYNKARETIGAHLSRCFG
jgi:glycosyltransferase involved in cell wall biosynthesis